MAGLGRRGPQAYLVDWSLMMVCNSARTAGSARYWVYIGPIFRTNGA